MAQQGLEKAGATLPTHADAARTGCKTMKRSGGEFEDA